MSDKPQDPFDLASGVPNVIGELRPTPRFADRISKRVLLAVFVFLGIVVFLFLVSLDHMDQKKKVPVSAKTKNNEDKLGKDGGTPAPKDLKRINISAENGVGSTNDVDKPQLAGSLVNESAPAPVSVANTAPSLVAGGPVVPSLSGVGPVPPIDGAIPKRASDSGAGASAAPLTPQQQAANQAKTDRLTRISQARSNGMSAKSFDGDGAASGGANSAPSALDGMNSALLQAAKQAGIQPVLPNGAQGQNSPSGDQEDKIKFTKEASKEDRGYHPYTPLPPVSPNELKVGSFIPLVLETGINSDLPGQITARSSEAVYDSVSGCRLLIPAMTKFVGRYDSKVALGQGRMLVVWNSAIFPDGSELNLAGMQGYDASGQSGLKSDVDNHYMRLFGLAFGMSMVTAAVQLSVPTPPASANGVVAGPSVAQTVSTALAQQYGQLGAQILSKYMNVQPTLRNYPGERFMITVPHTIVFNKVWTNRCNGRN